MPNEQNQKAIAVILDELDLKLEFESKTDRLEIQKAIYLSQRAGVNLSYWFNWYINGPYCSALADDYYEAKAKLPEFKQLRASDGLKSTLQKVKLLLEAKPSETSRADWLEALASLDYMRRVQRSVPKEALQRCSNEKPHLASILGAANDALDRFGFAS